MGAGGPIRGTAGLRHVAHGTRRVLVGLNGVLGIESGPGVCKRVLLGRKCVRMGRDAWGFKTGVGGSKTGPGTLSKS